MKELRTYPRVSENVIIASYANYTVLNKDLTA
jgi:hypothetical protein